MTIAHLVASFSLLAVTTASTAVEDDMTLVFEDDFTTSELNTDVWHIVEGNGCPELCGFGNEELQTYSAAPEHLRIKDGILIIEARRDGDIIQSAKITSQGRPGWKYGRIEARIRVPTGKGTWPAFWMLSDTNSYGGWPKSGEIDIMEHVGFDPDTVHGTIHTEAYNHSINTHKGKKITIGTSVTDFHVYAIDWTADSIVWTVDQKPYFKFEREENATSAEWPFDQPFHIILNLAIGGTWGGQQGVAPDLYPAQLEVDWVRVWQHQD